MWVTSHFPKIGKFTISKQSHKKKQANIRIKGKNKNFLTFNPQTINCYIYNL